MESSDLLTCPFCPFSDADASFLEMHIDHCHPENGVPETLMPDLNGLGDTRSPSPLPTDDESTEKYVDCPHGCGETVTAAELSTHLDLHLAEGIAFEETGADTPQFHADTMSADDDYDLPLNQEDNIYLQGALQGGKRGSDRDVARRNNTTKLVRPKSPPRTRGEDGGMRLGVCYYLLSNLPECANTMTSVQNWVHTPTRKRCPHG